MNAHPHVFEHKCKELLRERIILLPYTVILQNMKTSLSEDKKFSITVAVLSLVVITMLLYHEVIAYPI